MATFRSMRLMAARARTLTILFAVAQLLLPGALSVADAMVARAGPGSVAHVEDVSGQQCTRQHEADCVLCRFFSTYAAKVAAVAVPMPEIGRASDGVEREALPRLIALENTHARAPPVLLT